MKALEGVGIWSGELRFMRDRSAVISAAAELDELGFNAIWIPGGIDTGKPLIDASAELLEATSKAIIATGILSIWAQDAQTTAVDFQRLLVDYSDRFLLGLGISHIKFVDDDAKEQMAKPLTAMTTYLDALDKACDEDLSDNRILAALGPRMLELARDRSLGSHPYFVTPSHTRFAREILGPKAMLAPEQAVVLEQDPQRAREIARGHMEIYLGLPNYTNNLLRFGFTQEDLENGGSDRLVDAVVCWGGEDEVVARVAEHREAGANHVTLQVISGRQGEMPMPEWRRLADALIS